MIDRSYDETSYGGRGVKTPVSETIMVHEVPTTSSESYDVKEADSSCGSSSSSEGRCLTTVMLRNIPSRYSTKDLCEILHRDGFEAGSHYDFVYLPLALPVWPGCLAPPCVRPETALTKTSSSETGEPCELNAIGRKNGGRSWLAEC
mmetsp:Transcript_19408/g.16225  ORF Transcript_19408/g.16225 Transcript_19408/m.16225 type:complete len:147 (+) Transcript_19408:63-503(+)